MAQLQVSIPDELLARLKVKAALKSMTLKTLVNAILEKAAPK